MPFKIGIRVFVASYLPKINERLWSQSPDKDVLLLRKLQTSNYDTIKNAPIDDAERELILAKQETRKNHEKISLSAEQYYGRNSATDWNVTKGPVRTRIRK